MADEVNIFANLTGDSDPTGKFAKLEANVAKLEKERNADGTQKHPSVRHIHDRLRPTQKDLDRIFTTEDLIELCLKRPCCVRMDKFNPVEDYAARFRAEGRLQNRSQQHINKLLTKAIMKHKNVALYTQDEIDNSRKYHWMNRKRSNYLDLCAWKHQRELKEKKQNTSVEMTDDSDSTSDEELVQLGKDNINAAKHITADGDISDDEEIIEFVVPNNNNDTSEHDLNSTPLPSEKEDMEALFFNEADDSENFEIEVQTPQKVTAHELNQPPKIRVASFAAESEDLGSNSEINDYIGHINTDSIRLDDIPNSEGPLSENVQLQQSEPLFQSEQLPYEAFNTEIPLTSTQSQHESQTQ